MKIPIIKNLKTTIRKYIFPNCKNCSSIKSVLLNDINLKRISLEQTPVDDVFQKQNYSQVISGITNDSHKTVMAIKFLKTSPMDKEIYTKLSPKGLMMLRAQLTPDLVDNAESIITISKIIKNFLDRKYGENKYAFVSIGRSLSALANCLEFMGVETKHIPLSGCYGHARNVKQTVNTMIKQEEFKQYKQFLKETLQPKTNKKHIYCDYTATGKTLKIFKSLLNHRKLKLGSKKDEYLGINIFLENITKNNTELQNIINKFNRALRYQHFDKYAEIKHLDFKHLRKLHSALQPTDPFENKLMKFCLLDIFKTTKAIE